MTYLEICQTVRILAGAQGTGPISVEDGDTSGYETNLVRFVDTTYIDIQNARNNFKFLRASDTWNTTADLSTYTILHIPIDIKTIESIRVQKDSKWKYLVELDYDEAEYRFVNTLDSDEPVYFSREPGTGDIKMYPTPDNVYPVHLEYYRKPETMGLNEDVPMLPEEFHLAIVYKAADRFASFLGSPEIDEEYREAYRVMFQRLCSRQVPARDMRTRRGRGRRGFDI